ncbi:MAG TPA: TolC family protein [Methylibium sp.]|nr:TolC family protein [Methylibium sp.]
MDSRLPVAAARLAVCRALLLSLWPLAQALAAPPSSLPLDAAVSIATRNSRQVDAMAAQVRAARERAVVAGQRPDPVLKLGLSNLPIDGPDRFSVTRDFMTMRSVGLMQEVTRADKRTARRERAERDAALAEAERRQAEAAVQRDTALAWLDCSFAESMREQLLGQIAQASQQVQAAEAMYRGGRGAQADVYAARSEVEALRDRLDEAEREIEVARARLTRFVGDAAHAPLGERPVVALPTWVTADGAGALDALPDIAARREQEAAAAADARVADAERQADWSVELMYSQRGPAYSNMVSINLSVPLQWDRGNRQDREHAATLASLDEARARREDAERAVQAELQSWTLAWRSHERRLRRHDEALLPLAEQRAAAALSAYGAGSGSLTGVFEARRNALQVHLDRLGIEADIARLWAQLSFLMPHADGQALPRSTP